MAWAPITLVVQTAGRRRIYRAARAAVRPTLAVVTIAAYIVLTKWSKLVDDPVAGIFSISGPILIVFVTYFVLAMAGFKVSPEGGVDIPRIYAWPVLGAIFVLVFGAFFYLLELCR